MKRTAFLLSFLVIFSNMAVFAEGEDAPVLASYEAAYFKEQGTNNWYLCEYRGGSVTDLVYNTSNQRWVSAEEAYPNYQTNHYFTTGANSDGEWKFVSPMKGMARLTGAPYAYYSQGDGVTLSILKGDNVIWTETVAAGGNTSYNFITSLKKGEELHFRINCNNHNAYDSLNWLPKVEFLGIEYQRESDGSNYYQKCGDELTLLEYNDDLEKYIADDSMAFISDNAVMPSEKYSLLKRVHITQQGRYRVQADVYPTDNRGCGNIVKVYKNGEQAWEQMFPENEKGSLDVRMFCVADDVIDVEICKNKFAGYNYSEWSCKISSYNGSVISSAPTVYGDAYFLKKEYSLASLIGTTANSNGVNCYAERYGVKHPMTYSSTNSRWESSVETHGGYVSAKYAYPGNVGDTIIDVEVPESGLLKIEGNMGLPATSDGVLLKIYHNDKLLWSSCVGEERSLRWDDPYDTTYLTYDVNALADVNAGDTITFRFNKWKLPQNDVTNLENIMFKWISGNTISKTTKWKLEQSIVIDTQEEAAYVAGEKQDVDMYLENGTTYISADDAKKLFGAENTSEKYIKLRSTAEEQGKNVQWACDRLVLIYDGIPVLFGYPELCEIEVALNGGGLFD